MCPQLALEAVGSGDQLVMLHGLATDRRIWSMVVPRLAAGRRVVTLDLPGFGASAPADEGFELGRVADRIARGLAAQGVRGPYDLVGHSLGGAVALTLADQRPSLVRRLVLVAPAGLKPLPPALARPLAASAETVLAARRLAAPLTDFGWGRRLLLIGAAADGAALAPALARRLVTASATSRRTQAALSTVAATDLRPLLERLRAPLGVIWGQADRALPVARHALITALRPDAHVIELRGAGHLPMVERPGAFAAALDALIRDDTTSRTASPTVV